MTRRFAFFYFLVTAFVSTLGAADDRERTAGMISKAREILLHTQVVSTNAVYYGGNFPEANWALSIICASKEDPVGQLIELSEHCNPAGYVMCMLGVKMFDEKRFALALAGHKKKIEDEKLAAQVDKLSVQVAIGCSFTDEPIFEILQDKYKSWNRESLLRNPIPELWDTVRVEPMPELNVDDLKQAVHIDPPAPRKPAAN